MGGSGVVSVLSVFMHLCVRCACVLGYPLQVGVSVYVRISVSAGVLRCVKMTMDLREGWCTGV